MANIIGFDPVALAIDGGELDASLLRKLAYAATQGAEGIVTPLDCKVHQLSSAAGQVNIDTGVISILNRSTGGALETYLATASQQSTMDIDPTSGAARSDLVIVRLEDPEFTPWPPVDPGVAPTYQYTKPYIIKNVPNSTKTAAELNLGYSAYALARIDIPAGTTNITDGMIKDLRKMARPRSELLHFTAIPVEAVGAAGTEKLDNGDLAFTVFPSVASRNVDIPSWATEVTIEVLLGGVRVNTNGTWGFLRARIGSSGSAFKTQTQETGYDVNVPAANNYDRLTLLVADTKPIASQIRGTSQPFAIEGKKQNAITTGSLEVDSTTTISVKLNFREVPA